eukprot:TRINITY_DN25454_c0_g1_i1.p1 TRINITY_DN25454_c0_g1~~TRINITY_DN25454_c0_g1_i1.p1  ORF type:complete len:237 (-),score=45.32 TRINITY_DN25454_c0_g1_i1:422-1132(-)
MDVELSESETSSMESSDDEASSTDSVDLLTTKAAGLMLDDYDLPEVTPQLVTKFINELHPAVPLSVFRSEVLPLPPVDLLPDVVDEEKGLAFAWCMDRAVLVIDQSAAVLFGDDPVLARRTTEVLLALLQHRRSFGVWCDLKKHGLEPLPRIQPLDAEFMFRILVDHVRRWPQYSLAPLLTAHAVPNVHDFLSSQADVVAIAERVIQPLFMLLSRCDPYNEAQAQWALGAELAAAP